ELTLEYIASLTTSTEVTPQALVELLADLEASALTAPRNEQSRELLSTYYSVLLLSLLLVDDINEARFLSKRIASSLIPNAPSNVSPPLSELTAYPLIPLTYNLLRAVYTRSYSTIYDILLETPWPPIIEPVAMAFLEHFRRKTFKLLSYAYTTITPSQAAKYLGFVDSEKAILEKLLAEGWEWDGDQGLLKTVVKEGGEDLVGGVIVGSGVIAGGEPGKDGRIKRLTGLVTHLTEL
ncbi:COP9 signalosome, partial [Kalaharituber pfeilii]